MSMKRQIVTPCEGKGARKTSLTFDRLSLRSSTSYFLYKLLRLEESGRHPRLVSFLLMSFASLRLTYSRVYMNSIYLKQRFVQVPRCCIEGATDNMIVIVHIFSYYFICDVNAN